MRTQKNGNSFAPVKVFYKVSHHLSSQRIDAARWFVKEKDGWFVNKGLGKPETLTHACRKAACFLVYGTCKAYGLK
ncbi:hypothetical protein SDC9_155828 [bioreactor metagenome]|uniref:Uncharacterized protein n=1 Tax=bioreactor metagenome TaxID=1076179 RepID=A0A645F2J4_9ZZZZ